MNLLIIGGTSFFGTDIVRQALYAGHQVTICSRGNTRPEFWDRVSHISVDRADPDVFSKALSRKQFDVVIDNIAFNKAQVENALEVFEGNIGRYLFTSTNAVFMTTTPLAQPVSEEDAPFVLPDKPKDSFNPMLAWLANYTTGKIQAEEAILAQDKVPYTILRPPCVAGPEDRANFNQFYFQRLLDGKPLMLTNGGLQSYQPVYRCDLANAFMLALNKKVAINQIYNICQTKNCRAVDWVRLAAQSIGVEPNLVSIPEEALQAANFQYPEPFALGNPIIMNTFKARSELGFESTPIEEWTATTAKWYQETKHEDDSPNYANRAQEVEFAHRYQEALALIQR
jgi:nucleoside-diphosphate-sugar epimerase